MSNIITLSTGQVELPERLKAVGNDLTRAYFSMEDLVFFLSSESGIGCRLANRWSMAWVVYDQSPRIHNNCKATNQVFRNEVPPSRESSHISLQAPVFRALEYVRGHLPDYWTAFVYGRCVTPQSRRDELAAGIPRPAGFDPVSDQLVAVVEVHPNALP